MTQHGKDLSVSQALQLARNTVGCQTKDLAGINHREMQLAEWIVANYDGFKYMGRATSEWFEMRELLETMRIIGPLAAEDDMGMAAGLRAHLTALRLIIQGKDKEIEAQRKLVRLLTDEVNTHKEKAEAYHSELLKRDET